MDRDKMAIAASGQLAGQGRWTGVCRFIGLSFRARFLSDPTIPDLRSHSHESKVLFVSYFMFHGLGNLVLAVLFVFSWLFRRRTSNFAPTLAVPGFSFTALSPGMLTAWSGGELVYRLDIAGDRGANLDAPRWEISSPAFRGFWPWHF